ncbi:MFS transporter [Kitasatospora phosalacinea]|uniref:MFS transporter n=1 Tax=Kitasatospora phosalacinea TaxID=2065 RepID=A0A9W6PMB6_9ACTN|nr:MFS transporter [Kitasatospora phosalacinea]GLW58910.1 MFS transporter [Kitasatospora phosalacinea]
MSTSYLAVLRTPGAARLVPAALLGRLSYGTLPLSLLLAVADTTGSYARAGWLTAVFSAVSVLLFPARAGLVDRHGPRRTLPPMAVGYAAALLALTAATWHPGTPYGPLLLLATAAGALAPPLGPVTRAQWSILATDPELRRRAYSLDTVAEELLYVTGPLLAGLLAATGRPALGILLSAALALTGTLALAAVATPVPAAAPAADGAAPPRSGTRHLLGRARQPLSAAAGAGAGLAAFSLLAAVFAARHGRPADVAWVEAALAAGSATGGLVLGATDWRAPAATRLTVLTAALAAALALAALAPTLPALAAVAALTGLTVAPTLTTAYLLTDELAAPAERTRAGAWVNTSFNAGSSTATALTGTLLAHLPLPVCLLLAATPPLAALAGRRPLQRPGERRARGC